MNTFLKLLPACLITVFSQAVIAQNTPIATPSTPPAVTSWPYLADYTNSDAHNYVRTYTPQQPTSSAAAIGIDAASQASVPCAVSTAYMDGLGRPLQEVVRLGRTNGISDLVSVHVYDEAGRESYHYLPYSFADAASNKGKLKTAPLTQLSTQYSNLYYGQQPYAKTEYDNSPLNRVTKTMAPGAAWVGNNLGSTVDYGANTYNDDQVVIWNVDASTGNPVFIDHYPDGQLSVITTTDEDGHISYEYKDKQGQVILKKNFMKAVPVYAPPPSPAIVQLVYAATYYIYDDLGRLRWVLSPEAVKQSQPASSSASWTIAQAVLDGLCYHYEYDERGRMISKKLPGKDVDYMVYNARNLVVLTQDGNMRAGSANKWAFTTYDGLDRPLCTGIYDAGSLTRAALATAAGGAYGYSPSDFLFHVQAGNTANPYLVNVSGTDLYTRTHYDTYVAGAAAYDASWISQLTGQAPSAVAVPATPSTLTRGLVTGTDVQVLDGTGNTWISTTSYYDDMGRLIQQQAGNILGGTDVTTSQYDFSGTLISSVLHHTNPSVQGSDPYHAATTIVKRYGKNLYNGIVWKEEQNINNTGWRLIYSNSYDLLNRVSNKNLSPADNLFTYNIRGWLTGINAAQMDNQGTSDFFHEQLSYDQGFTDAHYNGNISGILWRGYGTGPAVTKKYYGYGYDNLDRLTKADFSEAQTGTTAWSNAQTDYTVSGIDYDLNGNLQHMNQQGPGMSTPTNMDALTYTYATASNQLSDVHDDGDPQTLAPDFRDANPGSGDYSYDANGNLTADANKGISSITYSYLNKPVHIDFGAKGSIDYLYDAQGNRLRKTTYDQTAGTTTVTDYDGPFVYQSVSPSAVTGSALQYILHEEGRCRPLPLTNTSSTAAYQYDYFIKDHLGNVRTVISAEQSSIGPWLMNPATYNGPPITANTGNGNGNGTHNYNTSLEVAQAATDALVWSHIDDVRADKPLSTSTTDTKAAMLVGTDTAKRVATALMLRVMPGDQFSLSAQSYYDALDSNRATTGDQVLGSLLGALTGGSEYGGGGVEGENLNVLNRTLGNPELPGAYNDLLSQAYDSSAPSAYLNYLVFDEHFKLVAGNSGVIQAGATPNQWNTMSTNGTVTVGQSGYLLVYASSMASRALYVDQTSLVFYSGAVLEENHYYPFGLTLTTATTNTAEKNTSNKFQNQRLDDDLGLNVYDYKYREHDMQTGRFWQIDPLAEKYVYNSTYAFSENKVTGHIELEGLEAVRPRPMDAGGGDEFKNFVTGVYNAVTGLFSDDKVAQRQAENTVANSIPGMQALKVISMHFGGKESRESITAEQYVRGGIDLLGFAALGYEPGPTSMISQTESPILSSANAGDLGFKAASEGAEVGLKMNSGSSFFEGTSYTTKVLGQMSNTGDIFHAFPKSIDGFAAKFGQVSTKLGIDGKPYQWLEMGGGYGGKTGTFEYIKDANGNINHRFFNVPKQH